MKSSNSQFSLSQAPLKAFDPTSLDYEVSSPRVNVLSERMTEGFSDEPALKVRACDEIPDHALTTCLNRCCDVIGSSKMGEREFLAVQQSAKDNLHGLITLKEELRDAEMEYRRLDAKAEPFFEKMVPFLEDNGEELSGFDAARLASLKETLTECVQAVTFAKYRRDQLRERLQALTEYVTDQIVSSVQARNLANPHLNDIREQVARAIFQVV
ncbi:MAG: hypothetical protein ACSHYF_17245 [Verrucomicrobiaceae bacterium]